MATINENVKGVAVAAQATAASADPAARPDERRSFDRFDVEWAVDCATDDTFLYAAITNISAMGIFVKTTNALIVGTRLMLAFEPPGYEPFKLQGEVAWVNPLRPNGDNPNPGMGVRFVDLQPENRERLVEVIRTIAYVREPA